MVTLSRILALFVICLLLFAQTQTFPGGGIAPATMNSANGNFSTPGSVTTGNAGGTTGVITINGGTSGSASISVPTVAGTPNNILLPTTSGTANQLLQSDGANPQQMSWVGGGVTVGTCGAGDLSTICQANVNANGLITGYNQVPLSSGAHFINLVCEAIYSFAVDGGAVSTITPVSTCTIPNKAIITGGTINSTTAVTSGGSATVSVGTSAGSSTTSILGATAKTSFTTNALLNSAATFAAPVKMSAAGSVTVTIGTAALTAGVIEILVHYSVSTN